jgi:hypothetical protein
MRSVLAESASAYQAGFLDQVLLVLWESATALGPQDWKMSGLTDNYLRVEGRAPQQFWNRITPVRLTGLSSSGFHGQLQGAVGD